MKTNKIKHSLAEQLSNDYNIWHNVLNDTQPGNYVCNQWEVEIDLGEIEIDIRTGFFCVNDGFFASNLTFELVNDKGSASCNKAFTAKGKFKLDNAHNLKIEEIKIEFETYIF
ncbi:hypothetical protein [Chryseobacterium oranimense]|uniref:hypothetical protein n=1 Tax=Chryseobacterium oranimense TaxID=421058 RepID=UPI0031DE1931